MPASLDWIARMQQRNDIGWAEESAEGDAPADAGAPAQAGDPAANDDGWQQYRRWISKAPAPRTRRSSIDPSLYTWKGYRSWAKQVKRNWPDS